MKKLENLLQRYSLDANEENNLIVKVLIHRGSITILSPSQELSDMFCQDCGSNRGYSCLHNGQRAWFCGTPLCLKTDATITKKIAL